MILFNNKRIIILVIISFILVIILKINSNEKNSRIVQPDSNSRLIYSEHIYHATIGFTDCSTSTGFGIITSQCVDNKLCYL